MCRLRRRPRAGPAAGTPWEALQAQLDEGGTVTLTNDVTAADGDAMLTVTNAVTLDLNGHTIAFNGSKEVVHVGTGGDLTLTNGLAAGAVTGGGDHGVYIGSNAVFRLQGGAIAGNTSGYGGGVFVNAFGSFEMSGGSITNNAVYDGDNAGGGVFVVEDGTFTMTGGTISGNAALWAGGVEVRGAFTMSGGEISSNTATNYGGGVLVDMSESFTVSGSAFVSGNARPDGAADNVYLYCATITVSNLTADASIGVTTDTAPNASQPITFATGATAGDVACFFSDIFGYEVELDGSDLQLVGELPQGFKNPEGREIEDYGVVDWLSNNGFTQADIDALGHDSAATDRLYECWLLNLNFKVQDAGTTLCFTDITVSNRVSMTVQLVRKAPLAGRINGTILIYGANDLAAGFDRDPIPDESVEYFTGDPTFNRVTASNDTVTQTAVATMNSSVTAKFFKAEIGIFTPYEPEEPWEPEPEPEPEE